MKPSSAVEQVTQGGVPSLYGLTSETHLPVSLWCPGSPQLGWTSEALRFPGSKGGSLLGKTRRPHCITFWLSLQTGL